MSDDTQTEVPGQQTLDDVAPVGRAEIDAALRGAPVNGDGKPKPARGPGGKFARTRPELDEPQPVPAAAAAADRADEARLQELADELNNEPCEDCPPELAASPASPVLGVLVLAAACVLGYIGADLVSRGAISRRLAGGARWDDEQ